MKRKARAEPAFLVQRWSRPPLSCVSCRTRKIRCDRSQPCSNCTQRLVPCVYQSSTTHATPDSPDTTGQASGASIGVSDVAGTPSGTASGPPVPASLEHASRPLVRDEPSDLRDRVQRLEQIILQPNQISTSIPPAPPKWLGGNGAVPGPSLPPLPHRGCIGTDNLYLSNPNWVTTCLPSKWQAKVMFQLFTRSMQPIQGVIPTPYAEDLIERVYRSKQEGELPHLPSIALMLSMFAGAAVMCAPDTLESLHTTAAEMKATFAAYCDLALSMLDDKAHVSTSGVETLLAINTLSNVLSHTDGYSDQVHLLRARQLLLARTMQIHRLDTTKRREEREAKGYSVVEIEIYRRVWWHMVASDWLLALIGGPQEGVYLIQPRHMKVDYPKHIDDEYIATDQTATGRPLSVPTCMSSFIHRIRLAELCREVVDTMPSVLLESSERETEDVDYEVIVSLDQKFQSMIHALPTFFQVDPISIQQSQEICRERPYIAWQRTILHFSIHGRLCRLHRPFHLEGLRNPRYAYSRDMSIRSAETVLNLRRSMDEIGALMGLQPTRYWLVMQHVFLAAITLATDVSLNPHAPGSASRKDEVLAACQMLEKSQHASSQLAEAIQKNTKTLLAILQSQRPQDPRVENPSDLHSIPVNGPGATGSSLSSDNGDGNGPRATAMAPEPDMWGQLWSDMFNADLDLDMPQWSLLFEDMDVVGV